MGVQVAVAASDLEDQGRKTVPNVFKRIPRGARNHIVAMIAEFMGTFLFLWVSRFTLFDGADNRAGSSPSPGHRLRYVSPRLDGLQPLDTVRGLTGRRILLGAVLET